MMQDRAFDYVKKQGLSGGYTDLFIEFAEQEIELAMSNMRNEKNNLSDQKESHRRTQRNLSKAIELLKAVLGKDDFIKLLQEADDE